MCECFFFPLRIRKKVPRFGIPELYSVQIALNYGVAGLQCVTDGGCISCHPYSVLVGHSTMQISVLRESATNRLSRLQEELDR